MTTNQKFQQCFHPSIWEGCQYHLYPDIDASSMPTLLRLCFH